MEWVKGRTRKGHERNKGSRERREERKEYEKGMANKRRQTEKEDGESVNG